MKIELSNPLLVPIGSGAPEAVEPGRWVTWDALPPAERLEPGMLDDPIEQTYLDVRLAASPDIRAARHLRLASLLVDRAVHPATSDRLAAEDFAEARGALTEVLELTDDAPLTKTALRANLFDIDLPGFELRRSGAWLSGPEREQVTAEHGMLLEELMTCTPNDANKHMLVRLTTRMLLEREPCALQTFTGGVREREAFTNGKKRGHAAEFYGWKRHEKNGVVAAEKIPVDAYSSEAVMPKAKLVNSPVARLVVAKWVKEATGQSRDKFAFRTLATWLCRDAQGERLNHFAEEKLYDLTLHMQEAIDARQM